MFFNYHLSDRCDLSCLGCPIHAKDTEEEFLPPSVIEADLTLLRKRHVRIINFTGGDPLLHPDIVAVTACAKKMGFYVIVTTAGVHYTAFPTGLKGNVDLVVFLVQGPDRSLHDARTGIVSFSRMVSGIDYAKENEIPVILAYPVTRDTVQLLPEMYEFAVSQGVILFIHPLSEAHGVQGFDRPTLDYLMYYGRRPHAWVNMARVWALKRGYPLEQTACLGTDVTIGQYLSDLNVRAVLSLFSLIVFFWKLFFLPKKGGKGTAP